MPTPLGMRQMAPRLELSPSKFVSNAISHIMLKEYAVTIVLQHLYKHLNQTWMQESGYNTFYRFEGERKHTTELCATAFENGLAVDYLLKTLFTLGDR